MYHLGGREVSGKVCARSLKGDMVVAKRIRESLKITFAGIMMWAKKVLGSGSVPITS